MLENQQSKKWVINAELVKADEVCAEISRCLAENGLDGHIFAMQILAHEALNNAVLHGSAQNPALKVACELQITPDAIRLQVTDEGPGFDWLSKIQKGLPVSTEENGRGFTLYGMYADELHFNQTGNQVLLIRRLRKG